MPERKQARAMDLPDYPCPPTLGEIATHAGSWGWFNAFAVRPDSATVAQDADGYLWVRADVRPTPDRGAGATQVALATWTEGGIALYLAPEAYRYLHVVDVSGGGWVPVASVLKEPPGYAQL